MTDYPQNTAGTTMDGLLAAVGDLVGEMRESRMGSTNFRRVREPYMVPTGLTASQTAVDAAQLKALGVTSFYYVNKNPFYVRLRGSNVDGGFKPVTLTTGWSWKPLSDDAFATQFPDFMSAIAEHTEAFPIVDSNGAALPGVVFRPIEIHYGFGA